MLSLPSTPRNINTSNTERHASDLEGTALTFLDGFQGKLLTALSTSRSLSGVTLAPFFRDEQLTRKFGMGVRLQAREQIFKSLCWLVAWAEASRPTCPALWGAWKAWASATSWCSAWMNPHLPSAERRAEPEIRKPNERFRDPYTDRGFGGFLEFESLQTE